LVWQIGDPSFIFEIQPWSSSYTATRLTPHSIGYFFNEHETNINQYCSCQFRSASFWDGHSVFQDMKLCHFGHSVSANSTLRLHSHRKSDPAPPVTTQTLPATGFVPAIAGTLFSKMFTNRGESRGRHFLDQ
jgi:hypothetical protein